MLSSKKSLKADIRTDHEADPNRSLPGKLIEGISDGVISGRFVPGQKLIEGELTASFGISRGSLREALMRLEADGVVRLSRNRGAYISSFSKPEMRDFIDILIVIIPFLGRIAAEAIALHKDKVSLRSARALLEKLNKAGTGSLEYLELRRKFYETLIEIGGNSQVKSVVPMMRIYLMRRQIQPYMIPADFTESLEMDRAITQAVIDGDPVKAERLMTRHLKRMRDRFMELPDEAYARDT